MSTIFQDWLVNASNPKARLVLAWFRLTQGIRRAPPPLLLLGVPLLVAYRVLVERALGIELPWNTQVGPDLRLYHGTGLVVNDQTIIGRNVVLRHNTTIGVKETLSFGTQAAPIIGDDVDIGAHVIILDPIRVGNGARIGACSVVVENTSASAALVTNPARMTHLAATLEIKHA